MTERGRSGHLAYLTLGVVISGMVGLGGCSDARPETAFDPETYAGKELIVDQPVGRGRLLVFRYGSPPELIKKDCIRGDGLDFILVDQQNREVWSTGCSEADEPVSVDHSLGKQGILRFTEWVFDPRTEFTYTANVPFVESTITLHASGTVHIDSKILLKPEAGGPERIAQLAEAAAKVIHSSEQDYDELYTHLAHLRNMAVADPEPVLKAFSGLRGTGSHDSEIISRCKDEVSEIESVRRGESP